MKQLLFIIITFLFVSNVYGEDALPYSTKDINAITIIDKGKILESVVDVKGDAAYHVIYKKAYYYCSFGFRSNHLSCQKSTDIGLYIGKQKAK